MKTAISIDDGLLQEADETARLMGLSRSRLFALAVGDFLQRQRREQMLVRLNEVYAGGMEPAGTAPLKGIKAKVRRAVKERGGARFGRDKCTGSTLDLRPVRRRRTSIPVWLSRTIFSTGARLQPASCA